MSSALNDSFPTKRVIAVVVIFLLALQLFSAYEVLGLKERREDVEKRELSLANKAALLKEVEELRGAKQKLEGEIYDQNQKIGGLKEKRTETEEAIKDSNDELVQIQKSANEVKATIADNEAKVAIYSKKLESDSKLLEKLQKDIEALRQDKSSLGEDIAKKKEAVGSLEEQLRKLNEEKLQFTTLKKDLEETRKAFADARDGWITANGEVKNAFGDAGKEIEGLKGDVVKARTSLEGTVSPSLQTLKQSLDSVNGQVTSMRDQINGFKATVNEINKVFQDPEKGLPSIKASLEKGQELESLQKRIEAQLTGIESTANLLVASLDKVNSGLNQNTENKLKALLTENLEQIKKELSKFDQKVGFCAEARKAIEPPSKTSSLGGPPRKNAAGVLPDAVAASESEAPKVMASPPAVTPAIASQSNNQNQLNKE